MTTQSAELHIRGVRQYCGYCYGQAQKAGRLVRQTSAYEYPLCQLCENRAREGLIHYRPSNGTEFMIFDDTCERCRHHSVDDIGCSKCAWGIVDQMQDQMFADYDAACNWFQPDALRTHDHGGRFLCPPECLRFTDRNDENGALRDPPPKDCIGQMFFSDVLTVPERVPVKREVVHA